MKILKKLATMTMLALTLVCLGVGSMPMVKAADYTALEEQIGIANGLESYDYTKESWQILQDAVELGNKWLSGETEQSKVDQAVEEIKLGIENLVKMDYGPLIDALDVAYAKIDEDPQLHDVWYRLDKAVDKARPLLVSGDQQAVNEMTENLIKLVEELEKIDAANEDPGVIIQEVEIEVPPTSDFCNIPMHRTWPLLFTVSAALNVLLIVSLGLVLFKKRTTTDNMPLVDYDIEDDIDLNELN